ncbi:MAG: universal stress protein [Halothiobacillaceae bacterium]|nr:universal stress protein [Halothiobacillaceae bacterium]
MKRFDNILYVAENEGNQEAAIARAVTLAQNNQARLTVMDVIPPLRSGRLDPVQLANTLLSERREALEALIAPYRDSLPIQVDVLIGVHFLEVIRAVLRNTYDLVIKLAQTPVFINRLFGSDDMHLLRKCPCPVWLMKADERPNYACILAAVDFDSSGHDADEHILNQQILQLASSLALSDFAELHLVHAWEVPEASYVRVWVDHPDATEMAYIEGERIQQQNRMRELIQRLPAWIGSDAAEHLSPRIHLPMGRAVKEIPALAESLNADLVVMGTVARTGIPGFIIGNTAEAIIDQLQCSLLATKPVGFKTPVSLD